MFCKFCGKKIDDDSIHCPECGKNLQGNSEEKPKATLERDVPSAPIITREMRAEHLGRTANSNVQVETPENSTKFGIVAWVLSIYAMIIIAFLIMGSIGYTTTTEIFQINSASLVYAVGFMLGNFGLGESVPIIVTALIPYMIMVLAVVFSVLQITKNKRKFSYVTIITVCSLIAVMLCLSFFGYNAVVGTLNL